MNGGADNAPYNATAAKCLRNNMPQILIHSLARHPTGIRLNVSERVGEFFILSETKPTVHQAWRSCERGGINVCWDPEVVTGMYLFYNPVVLVG